MSSIIPRSCGMWRTALLPLPSTNASSAPALRRESTTSGAAMLAAVIDGVKSSSFQGVDSRTMLQ